jgi:hypothetical protein
VQSGTYLINVAGIMQQGERYEYLNSSSEANCAIDDLFDDIEVRDERTGTFLQGLAYLASDVQLASLSVNELYVLSSGYQR